jgi:hypothetical protein
LFPVIVSGGGRLTQALGRKGASAMMERLEHANLCVHDIDAGIRFLMTAFPDFKSFVVAHVHPARASASVVS